MPKDSNQEDSLESLLVSQALKEEDFGSLFLYNLEVLSIVTDTDPEELEDLEPEKLVEYIYELNFLRREPS